MSDDLPWLPRLLANDGIRSYACGKLHLANVLTDACHQHPVRVGFTWHRGHLTNLNGSSPYSWPKNIASAASWSWPTTTTFVSTTTSSRPGTRWMPRRARAPSSGSPSARRTRPGPSCRPPISSRRSAACSRRARTAVRAAGRGHAARAAHALWTRSAPRRRGADAVAGHRRQRDAGAAVESPWPNHQHKAEVFEGGVNVPLIAYGAGGAPARPRDGAARARRRSPRDPLELFNAPPLRAEATDSISFAPILADANAPAVL